LRLNARPSSPSRERQQPAVYVRVEFAARRAFHRPPTAASGLSPRADPKVNAGSVKKPSERGLAKWEQRLKSLNLKSHRRDA
jgi:hypothetical protein